MELFPWDLYFGKDEQDAKRPLNRILTRYGVVRTFITVYLLTLLIDLFIERLMGWGLFAR